MKIIGIDHIGIAVHELKKLQDVLGKIPGLTARGQEDIPDQQVLTDIYDTGQGKIELIVPTGETSPIQNYLQKRGPGLHHIALKVDDIQAVLQQCREKGIELIDETPRIGAEGYRIAFLHPRSTGGILIELCEEP